MACPQPARRLRLHRPRRQRQGTPASRSWPSCARPRRSGGTSSPIGKGGFDDGGYWAVTKHADVTAVSKHSEVFSSWENGAIIRFAEDMKREQVELQRVMLNMDAPDHTKLRQIISRGFTPRAIGAPAGRLRPARAEHRRRPPRPRGRRLRRGGGVRAAAPGDRRAARRPQEDRDKLFDWSNQMTGVRRPRVRRHRPDDRPRPSHRVRDGAGRGAQARTPATTSSPSWSTPTSTARSSPTTSSASS